MKILYSVVLIILAIGLEGPEGTYWYELEFHLADGRNFNGYVRFSEELSSINEGDITDWIKKMPSSYHDQDRLRVCLEKFFYNIGEGHYAEKCNYCHEDEMLNRNEIKKVRRLRTIKDSNFYIGDRLSEKEISQLKTDPISAKRIYIEGDLIHDSGGDYFTDYWLISYNNEVRKMELEKIAERLTKVYLNKKPSFTKWYEPYNYWDELYNKTREELNKKEVILLQIGY